MNTVTFVLSLASLVLSCIARSTFSPTITPATSCSIAMKLKLRSATIAVRSHAADARQRAEFVVADAERLVAALECDDLVAANQR